MRKKIKRSGKFYVYIVKCNNGTLYTGYTNNLKSRIALHNNGKGAKYTRDRRPVKLVWSKKHRYFKNAFLEEKRIKKLTRIQKEQLINYTKRGQRSFSKVTKGRLRALSFEDSTRIKIRRMSQQDKKAFIELSLALSRFNKKQHDKYYSNFQDFLHTRKRKVEKAFSKISQSPHKMVLMAFQNKKAVGYLRAFIYGPNLNQGCLDEFFLNEEVRGQGIGKKLLGAAIRWMSKQKVIRIIASVYLWNTSARRFYEQEGFHNYAVSYEKVIPPPETK
ncbi:GNAT family N-acetyltransferase [Candidatus Omnitrophota bacterium]